MEIISSYRDRDDLRASFNDLAVRTFGLSFEDWYQNGFWKENYNPYSMVEDGKVVSNVSVNQCDMNFQGETVRLIQLGTIMTDPDHRGKGYARKLMERVISDYFGRVDGIYLFANDSVLGFYPKFGFRTAKEYQYAKEVTGAASAGTVPKAEPVPMSEPQDWEKMKRILAEKPQNSAMYMVGNTGLYMFYLSQFMQENVYYIPRCDSYAIAEPEGETLVLHTIIGEGSVDDVVASFGEGIRKVILCFTPRDPSGYEKEELHEEDTTLFVQGRFFDAHPDAAFMFQSITHA